MKQAMKPLIRSSLRRLRLVGHVGSSTKRDPRVTSASHLRHIRVTPASWDGCWMIMMEQSPNRLSEPACKKHTGGMRQCFLLPNDSGTMGLPALAQRCAVRTTRAARCVKSTHLASAHARTQASALRQCAYASAKCCAPRIPRRDVCRAGA